MKKKKFNAYENNFYIQNTLTEEITNFLISDNIFIFYYNKFYGEFLPAKNGIYEITKRILIDKKWNIKIEDISNLKSSDIFKIFKQVRKKYKKYSIKILKENSNTWLWPNYPKKIFLKIDKDFNLKVKSIKNKINDFKNKKNLLENFYLNYDNDRLFYDFLKIKNEITDNSIKEKERIISTLKNKNDNLLFKKDNFKLDNEFLEIKFKKFRKEIQYLFSHYGLNEVNEVDLINDWKNMDNKTKNKKMNDMFYVILLIKLMNN
ncbi:MAG: hypothetical protein ACRDA7_01670 [Metamycoplasmataceae bacterium]